MKSKNLINYSIIITIFLVLLNLLIYHVLIAYIQKTANQHLSIANFSIIVISVLSLISIILGLKKIFNKKKSLFAYLLICFGINLLIWIPVIFNIQCQNCLIN